MKMKKIKLIINFIYNKKLIFDCIDIIENYIMTEFKNVLDNNIIKYFELDDKFYEIMSFTGGFISGSTALYSYLNKPLYDNQDLDIFVRTPMTKELYDIEIENRDRNYESYKNYYPNYGKIIKKYIGNYLESKNYKYIESDAGQRNQAVCKKKSTNEIEYHFSDLKNYIMSINTFQNENKKIQIIVLFDCSIDDFINTFDLNICKLVIKSNLKELYFDNKHLNDK